MSVYDVLASIRDELIIMNDLRKAELTGNTGEKNIKDLFLKRGEI